MEGLNVGEKYDNKNRGALFPNDRKTEGDQRPNYTGKLEMDRAMLIELLTKTKGTGANIVLFVSGWVKVIGSGDRTGQKMLSLAVQPPKEKPVDQSAPKEDDIPF
jgi:hypothetical protein